MQPEVALGDDAERAQRAGEELGEVVACDVLDHLAAGLGYSPIREDYSYADDDVPDRPVAVAARPRGVRRDDAPDSRPHLWRVYAEHLVGADEPLLQVVQPHPGLDPDHLVPWDVLYNPVHPRGAQDEI
jgi:hypothetical protein